MNSKTKLFALMMALLIALLTFSSVLAGSVTVSGITLNWPDYPLSGPGYPTCEPWNEPALQNITLTNVPNGSTIIVTFVYANPYNGAPVYQPPVTYSGVGGFVQVPVIYPTDTSLWPVFNTLTNERAISVGAFVRVIKADGSVVKLIAKQWWVRCVPPPPPFEGCTPGYWRQEQHFDSWLPTGYAPLDDFEAVFGVNASFDPDTLLDAVWLGGGGEFALARHAVAAVLNAAHPDINYQFTPAEIIAGVQQAYASGDFETFKSQLDFANNAGCPLN